MSGCWIVTGGNRGIGLGICQGLSALGHDVILVSRDGPRGEAALGALPGPGRGRLLMGDVGSLEGAAALAQGIDALDTPIRALVHNAGIWPTELALGPDGLERSFVVNHLSPLLLNHRLSPRLKADGARVVQVSAGLYVAGRYDPERTPRGEDFSRMRTYATTKQANLLATLELAERWGLDVPIHAVHPGVIQTGLGDSAGPIGWLLRLVKRRWGTPEAGARGPIRLATEAEFGARTGVYLNEVEEAPLTDQALDGALRAVVWQQAMSLLEGHL